MTTPFHLEQTYSRHDVQLAVGAKLIGARGAWGRGLVFHDGAFHIFANVEGPDSLGVDHGNHWVSGPEGGRLEWCALSKRPDSPEMKKLFAADGCHIFTREDTRTKFVYRGFGRVASVTGSKPTRVTWTFEKTHGASETSEWSPSPTTSLHRPYVPASTTTVVHADVTMLAKDPALLERALAQHGLTQNALAGLVEEAGLTPCSPNSTVDYDLSWQEASGIVLAEIKSLSETNETSQIRHGIGQLLDYATRVETGGQQVSRLLLALERRPSEHAYWVKVCSRAGIMLSWAPHFEGVLTAPEVLQSSSAA